MSLGTTVTSIGTVSQGLAVTDRVALTTIAAVPAGATALAMVSSTTAGRVLLSVTDDQGNTWRIDQQFNNLGDAVPICAVSLWCPSGLPLGTVITAIWSSSINTTRSMHAGYVTGRAIVDRVAGVAGGPSTAWSSGATLPTSIAGCLAFGAASLNSVVNNTNMTGSSPAFTELHDTNGGHTLVTAYSGNIANASAVNAAGNWSISNGSWLGVVVVYRDYTAPLNDQAVWSLGQRGEGNVNTNSMTLALAEIPVGATAFAVISSTTADRVLSTVTDSLGNVWTIDRVVGGSPSMHLASCYFPNGLAHGTVLTATWANTAITSRAIQAGYMSKSRIPDVSAVGGATAQAWSTGATAATAANNGVAIAGSTQANVVPNNNTTGSSPAFSELLDNPGGLGLVTTFAVGIASGTAVTAAGTWSNAGAVHREGVVVYKIVKVRPGSPSNQNGTTWTVPLPIGMIANDVALIFVASDVLPSSASSGSLLVAWKDMGGGGKAKLLCYKRTVTAQNVTDGNLGTISFPTTAKGATTVGQVVDADPAQIVGAWATSGQPNAATSFSQSIDPPQVEDVVMAWAVNDATSFSFNPPANTNVIADTTDPVEGIALLVVQELAPTSALVTRAATSVSTSDVAMLSVTLRSPTTPPEPPPPDPPSFLRFMAAAG